MTTTPDSKRRDTRPKKRKRDPAEAERQAKNGQKRVRKQNGGANGLLGAAKLSVVPDSTAEDVKSEASALQPVTRSQEATTKALIARRQQDDTQEAGWAISRPLGGRISDIDPILTADERYSRAERGGMLTKRRTDRGFQVLDSSILDFRPGIYHCRLSASAPNSYYPRPRRRLPDCGDRAIPRIEQSHMGCLLRWSDMGYRLDHGVDPRGAAHYRVKERCRHDYPPYPYQRPHPRSSPSIRALDRG